MSILFIGCKPDVTGYYRPPKHITNEYLHIKEDSTFVHKFCRDDSLVVETGPWYIINYGKSIVIGGISFPNRIYEYPLSSISMQIKRNKLNFIDEDYDFFKIREKPNIKCN